MSHACRLLREVLQRARNSNINGASKAPFCWQSRTGHTPGIHDLSENRKPSLGRYLRDQGCTIFQADETVHGLQNSFLTCGVNIAVQKRFLGMHPSCLLFKSCAVAAATATAFSVQGSVTWTRNKPHAGNTSQKKKLEKKRFLHVT